MKRTEACISEKLNRNLYLITSMSKLMGSSSQKQLHISNSVCRVLECIALS